MPSTTPHRGQGPTLKAALTPLFFLVFCGGALADAYLDARSELIAAYEAEDYAAMQVAANRALLARPGYPAALFNLAYAKALHGDAEGALAELNGLVEQGIDFGVADIDEFSALQQLPGWPAYSAAVEALQQPIGDAGIAFTYDVGDFVPEGIVALGDELLLGSIRHGSIVRLGRSNALLSDAEAAGHWSVFGMRLGPDGGLWFVSAAVPEYAGVDAASAGSTGLFRLDLESGDVMAHALLPMQEQPLVLGDLVFAGANTIYLTESLAGALYRYTIGTGELMQVIAPGVMRSLQGLVLDGSGKFLYVADYVGGLFRVRLSDYNVERVTAARTVSVHGIDGLYRHGNRLIAIQNGIRPNRVVALTLNDRGTAINSSRVLARNLPHFDEPTLGTIVGDDFLFVANSHWNRFDRDGNLDDDLSGPVILRIALGE